MCFKETMRGASRPSLPPSSCRHCHGTGYEIQIDKSDPSGVWHECAVPCRCQRILSPSWPWLLLVLLALLALLLGPK